MMHVQSRCFAHKIKPETHKGLNNPLPVSVLLVPYYSRPQSPSVLGHVVLRELCVKAKRKEEEVNINFDRNSFLDERKLQCYRGRSNEKTRT